MLGAGAFLSGGCGPQAPWNMRNRKPLDAWVAGEMVNLTERTERRDDLEVYDSSAKAVSLQAGANETVSFQVVMEGGKRGVGGVTVDWSELSTSGGLRMPASSIRVYRMLPIEVTEHPDWYIRLADGPAKPVGVFDPLVPIDPGADPATTFNVKPGKRLAIWVDLAVPRSARPGNYTARFNLTSSNGQKWSATIGVEVLAYVLPDARRIPVVGSFGHRELMRAILKREGKPFDPVHLDLDSPMARRGLALVRKLMIMAREHRIDLFDTDVKPVLKRTGLNEVRLAWDDYDAIVQPYLDGSAFEDGVGVPAWPMPLSQDWPRPDSYGGIASETYTAAVRQLLAESIQHLGAKGESRGSVFIWPGRDLAAPTGYATHMSIATLARKAAPGVPILSQLPPAAPPGSDWQVPTGFGQTVDIFTPPGELFDADLAARRSAAGSHPLAGAWLAPGTPPYLPGLDLIGNPADARALPWFAMKYACTGIWLPDVLHWSDDTPASLLGARTRLFYPGSIADMEAPLPSVRLKRLRRGMQDIAQLWILNRRGRQGVAKDLISAMVRYGGLAATRDNYLDCRLDGWAKNSATWELARRILVEEVQAAVTPATANRLAGMAHQLGWSRFKEQTHVLVVEGIRSIVAPAPGSTEMPPKKLRMTILMDVFNQHNRPGKVWAELENLPAGWKQINAPNTAVTLGESKLGLLTIQAEGPGPLPAGAGARMPVSVTLKSNVEAPRRLTAEVAMLVVGRANRSPKVDGDLRDWPLRVGNTARDFRLVGRRGQIGTGLARRQTLAFMLRDADNLYLAFRCEEPNPAGMIRKPTNRVTYQQLIACGEDLVEVLLDPGGKARKAADLYHLVVKPNGVLIAQRGVASTPSLGAVTHWAASANVAIGSATGAWTVEIRIPLSSFGPDGASAFWRANFMRFSPQGQESSNWSGAPRYFYDPRNLGTIFVGDYQNTNPQP